MARKVAGLPNWRWIDGEAKPNAVAPSSARKAASWASMTVRMALRSAALSGSPSPARAEVPTASAASIRTSASHDRIML